MKAAKEAGLTWIHDSGLVEKSSGREVYYSYIREMSRSSYVPHLEYHQKRREENRCKCYRKKDKDGNCPTCSRTEVMCLCKYDNYF